MQENSFCVGDYIVEKGDKKQIVYEIYALDNTYYFVSGLIYRIEKKIKKDFAVKASGELIETSDEVERSFMRKAISLGKRESLKHLTGKILHIDGDKKYLNKCIDLYKELGLYCFGVCIKEEDIPSKIVKYYNDVLPDIIVITGHDLYNNDGVKDLNNYTNSKYYIKAIKEIRKVNRDVVVIAGACQSNFEALIASGADFASSPGRINIHTFDPAVIAVRVATTSVSKIVNLNGVFKYIENGNKAFGGLETFGKMRLVI